MNRLAEYSQSLAYWTYKYYTGHIIASYCFQSPFSHTAHTLLQFSYFLKNNKKMKVKIICHFTFLFIFSQKGGQMTNNCDFHVELLLLIF